jgi:hypothetical protein
MNKQDYETRLSQLEIDVRQLRQLLKPQPQGDNPPVVADNVPHKRKPGRPRGQSKDTDSSD